MTPRVRSGRLGVSIVVGFCAASCGRVGFDLLPQDSQQAVTTGGGGAGGGRTDAAASTNGGSNGTPGTGGATSGGNANGGASGNGATGGATSRDASTGGASSGGATSTGGRGPDAGPPPLCGSSTGTAKVWSFSSSVESWQFWPDAGTGALSWTAATGNPTAGALSMDITGGTGRVGWIVMDAAAPNLTGHTGAVWLWLDTQTNGTIGVKIYAQSDITKFAWADGGFIVLTPKTWTCVTIDFDTPVYKDATFDPTKVVRFGIELSGTAPLTLYADQFAY